MGSAEYGSERKMQASDYVKRKLSREVLRKLDHIAFNLGSKNFMGKHL